MDTNALKEQYYSLIPTLKDVLKDIVLELREFVEVKGLNNIDYIKGRVKDVNSFLKKASMEDENKNELKYQNPLLEIQDIIGLRIIVYYLDDVDKIYNVLNKSLYQQIEIKHHRPKSEEDFEYEGKTLYYSNFSGDCPKA